MSLDTYANLKAEVADWLNRTDLTTQVPTFITLAEAEMKRKLRIATTRTTITISAEETTLPADTAELRSISLESASPSQDLPFRFGTPEMLAERRARNAAVTGRPTGAIVVGSTLVVSPVPDQSYTARITYFTQVIPLSDSVTTSDVLTDAPDAYLYGALLQSAAYLEHDERIPVWQEKFDKAIDQLNVARENQEHGASVRAVRGGLRW